MLGLVQQRLAHLEGDNSAFRRRLRELEHELDNCKVDIAIERENIMQQERVLRDRNRAQAMSAQNPGAAGDPDRRRDEKRYKEAVEEKKGAKRPVSCKILY